MQVKIKNHVVNIIAALLFILVLVYKSKTHRHFQADDYLNRQEQQNSLTIKYQDRNAGY